VREGNHARADLAVSEAATSQKEEAARPETSLQDAPLEQPTAGESNSLRSCLYECDVMHHRLEPKEHHFRYRIFMFAIDLDELDRVANKVVGFAHNRRSIYEFRDRDHLTLPELGEGRSVKEHLTAFLGQHGIRLPGSGRITLVTLPRVLGYIFNPVSFYFCHDAMGAPLCAVVQVGNTFGEMKPYVIPQPSGAGMFRLVAPKHFYVSPFSELDVCFDFKLKVPGEQLDLHIDDRIGERRVLLSAVTGRRVPLTTGRLAWLTLKYPFITLKVIALIHWHAALLWLKRLPWHRKTANAHLQRDVLRPHSSIAPPHP